MECLEANEVKLASYVYHSIFNICFVHIAAHRHGGRILCLQWHRDTLQFIIEVVNKALYTVMLNYLPMDFNLI